MGGFIRKISNAQERSIFAEDDLQVMIHCSRSMDDQGVLDCVCIQARTARPAECRTEPTSNPAPSAGIFRDFLIIFRILFTNNKFILLYAASPGANTQHYSTRKQTVIALLCTFSIEIAY